MENQLKNSEKLETAIADLELVKSLIAPDAGARSSRAAVISEIKIVFLLLMACTVFLVWEIVGGRIITEGLLASTNDLEFQVIGIGELAVALLVISSGVYYFAWRRASEMSARLSRTVSRDFPYLAARAFVPDLIAKFAALSVTLVANQPALVGPLLLVFAADYVFQGRFFDLPGALRAVAGSVGLGLAIHAAVTGDPAVIKALTFFATLALASIVRSAMRLTVR